MPNETVPSQPERATQPNILIKTSGLTLICAAGFLLAVTARAELSDPGSLTPTPRPAAISSTGGVRHPARGGASHRGRVTVSRSGDDVVIRLHFDRPEAWNFNMASGQLTLAAPQPRESFSPLPHIRIAVKKEPFRSAAVAIPISGGAADLSSLEDGGYALTVYLPNRDGARYIEMPVIASLYPGWERVVFYLKVSHGRITRDASPSAIPPQ
ncbi:MAG: hypothetical protein H0X40_16815 [Chthoniobacterales bacterium]|nr:hypothetical protein [Chthoniobacterales bacterium]